MSFDVLTLANLHSLLDSHGIDPNNNDILAWNAIVTGKHELLS